MTNTAQSGTAATQQHDVKLEKRTARVIFASLLLDLTAFTLILPLFPRLVEHFVTQDAALGRTSLLPTILNAVRSARVKLQGVTPSSQNERYDVVLLGGLLGSLFSLAQFLISPVLGHLSDRYGRKRVLLLSLLGNILSAVVWMFSVSFDTFLLSRVIGGLSEGNVQLSIAILSDVSRPETRAKSLALVGIAFSICFTIGPMFGAWLASRPFYGSLWGLPVNIYAYPALFSTAILVVETLLLVFFLPETLHAGQKKKPKVEDAATKQNTERTRQRDLQALEWQHFLFLLVFSGCEFTLTFLMYDLLDYGNKENGKLLAFIGLSSSLLTGGYVRRASKQKGSVYFARSGMQACAVGLYLFGMLPHLLKRVSSTSFLVPIYLHLAALALAYCSASVVTSLTTLASLSCDATKSRGEALGRFRSQGQLGRALGPLLSTVVYWHAGPTTAYLLGASAMWFIARRTIPGR